MKYSKKQIQDRFVSRRQFLIGTGTTFLTLPPLVSLMSRTAEAQTLGSKKVRAVVYVGTVGIEHTQMYPATVSGLTPYPSALNTSYKSLNSFPTTSPISAIVDQSFRPMFPQMNLLRGLSMTGGLYAGHNTSILAGIHSMGRSANFGRSFDVVIEKSPNVYPAGQSVAMKAMRIVNEDADFSYDAVAGVRTNSSAYKGDAALFNALFPQVTGGTPAAVAQNNANNQLIVDQVYGDLKVLQNDRRISKADKTLVDRFISSVYDLQLKVRANANPSTCAKPNLTLQVKAQGNGHSFPEDPKWGITSVAALYANYIEIIKIAFMCDLTRVVYIGNSMWDDAPIAPSSLGGLHHTCVGGVTEAGRRQQYGFKKMFNLAQTLNGVVDPLDSNGKSLLYNSVILCTNELGAWTPTHNVLSMPAITFGSGGGLIKTGNYVDYTQPLTSSSYNGLQPGRPYKQLLQTIMQAVGVPKSEYMLYGDGNGYGEFKTNINQFGHVGTGAFAPYANEHNDLLPFIT